MSEVVPRNPTKCARNRSVNAFFGVGICEGTVSKIPCIYCIFNVDESLGATNSALPRTSPILVRQENPLKDPLFRGFRPIRCADVRLEPFKNWGTNRGTISLKVGYDPTFTHGEMSGAD
jgi:hypothetical protein